jgi:hypothetical protein
MIIKTMIDRQDNIDDKEYINKPVLDRFTSIIDIKNGVITGHDDSKVIGVIIDAVTIDDKVELTIALWTQASQLQGEYLLLNGKSEPSAFSMGFKIVSI